VVGHDDEIEQAVSLRIEVQQAIADDACQRRVAEQALAMAFVQLVMPTIPKQLSKLADKLLV
jgi:hypothetical protein